MDDSIVEYQKQQVINLGRKLGIEYEERDPTCFYSWDGKTATSLNTPSNLLHDIAHWLCCKAHDETRLQIEEFGLGASPDSHPSDLTFRTPLFWFEASEEEREASALGILLEEWMGFNWEETVKDHCWSVVQELREVQHGAIDHAPTWLVEKLSPLLS